MSTLTLDQIANALANPNVKAMLRVIRQGESGQTDSAYRMRYTPRGTAFFDDFSKHPQIYEPTPTGQKSSAAGAYQIVYTTWEGLVNRYGFTDFTPATQDAAAVCLLNDCGALAPVLNGDLFSAVVRAGRVWASLPDSPLVDGGSKQSWTLIEGVYADYGGQGSTVTPMGPDTSTAPAPRPPSTPSTPSPPDWDWGRGEGEIRPAKEPIMADTGTGSNTGSNTGSGVSDLIGSAAPVIGAFNPLLGLAASLFPKIGALVLDRTKSVPERNVAIGTEILNTIQTATGAKSHAEGLAKAMDDPVARQSAETALKPFFTVVEAGSGGIQSARDFNLKASGDGRFYVMPAFWITILLLPLLYGVVYFVLTGPTETFSGELRAAIASSVVTGVLGSVLGFWLGSSLGSQRKDQTIQAATNR